MRHVSRADDSRDLFLRREKQHETGNKGSENTYDTMSDSALSEEHLSYHRLLGVGFLYVRTEQLGFGPFPLPVIHQQDPYSHTLGNERLLIPWEMRGRHSVFVWSARHQRHIACGHTLRSAPEQFRPIVGLLGGEKTRLVSQVHRST